MENYIYDNFILWSHENELTLNPSFLTESGKNELLKLYTKALAGIKSLLLKATNLPNHYGVVRTYRNGAVGYYISNGSVISESLILKVNPEVPSTGVFVDQTI